MPRRTTDSVEQAQNALHLLIGLNILVYMFRDDLASQLSLSKTYRIFDGNIQSMVVSMFYHMEPPHLMINMLALYQYGNALFVHSSSRRWRSFYMILFAYIGEFGRDRIFNSRHLSPAICSSLNAFISPVCGILSFKGLEILSRYHEHQWRTKLSSARDANKCTHWLCDSINKGFGTEVTSLLTNAWSDLTTSLPFTNIVSSMYHFQLVRRIGASGVVYGWMGMRLVTSLFSQYHSRMSSWDYFFLISTLAHDLSKSPLTLDDLRNSTFLEGDGIDHAAHFFGAIGGMLLAICIMVWDKASFYRSWQGQGRRLGERREDEQRRAELDQRRRERSRLLNHEGSSMGNRQRTAL